mgnify:CR=1 FL=1
MLSIRIVGVINIISDVVVQSIGFNKYLPIGSPDIAINYLDRWGIDEIVILDIKSSINGETKLYKNLAKFTEKCCVPVSAGGGVKKLKDIENLITNGADKVIINSSFFTNENIVTDGAKEFGSQAIIVSIDVKKIDNEYIVFSHSGSKKINIELSEVIKNAEDKGAGELLINSIDRDGSKKGYDINLIEKVKNITSLPLVCCGGVGKSKHFLDAMYLDTSGLAAGNYFHYNEHSVILLKRYLLKQSDQIRLDTYANYKNHSFNFDQRLDVLPDNELEKLRFVYIPEEKL